MSLAYAIHDMLSPVVQAGGAKAASKHGGGLLLFAIILALFLIRAYIVQFAFNRAVPGLIARVAENPEKNLANFRPISFTEAIFLTLLASSLFGS